MNKKEYICINCNKSFIDFTPKKNRKGRKFCCKQCMLDYGKNNRNVKTNCNFCGKEISVYNSGMKNYKTHYCSRLCYLNKLRQANAKTKKVITCHVCGKTFIDYINYLNYKNNTFCSLICYNIYRNDIKLKGKDYRQVILRLKEHKCEICGWYLNSDCLDVHHKDFNRQNSSYENLTILCPQHHAIITRGWGNIIDDNFYMYNDKLMGRHKTFTSKISKNIRKENDSCMVYCQKCNGITSATIKKSNFKIGNKIIKNILLGFCNICNSVVSVPKEILYSEDINFETFDVKS